MIKTFFHFGPSLIDILLICHFVGDFLFQSDWMAVNKSKDWKALLAHVAVYSACFSYFGPLFVAITFVTHFVTDAITSRITTKLWFIKVLSVYPDYFTAIFEDGKRHWFFVVIGLDQLIHYVTLLWTLNLTH